MRLLLKMIAVLALVVGPVLAVGTTPADAASGRWIDVDLSALTATAMSGNTPVYSAPITAGMPGFETPTGSFSVLSRVYSETMDSATTGIPRNSPNGYYVTNVMYTQYITGDGVALHGNYWARPGVFGSANTSHGCIGMSNGDAAYFWNFATYGTPVEVHY